MTLAETAKKLAKDAPSHAANRKQLVDFCDIKTGGKLPMNVLSRLVNKVEKEITKSYENP